MSYPPSPVPPPVPKPSRGGRTTVIVVAIVLAVVLLCCVGAVGAGVWLFRAASVATEPARVAATAYLDALRAGDYAAAYQRLCREQRSALTEEEFTERESRAPRITDYEISGTGVSSVNGRGTGSVTVDVTYEGGAERQETIRLVREGGEWRVCG